MSKALKIGLGAYALYNLLKLSRADCDLLTYSARLHKEYFRDRVIWITGASSGIGKELATQLSELDVGVKLILSSRRRAELEKVDEALKCDSVVIPVDLHDLDSLNEVSSQALSAFGHIDILINNGGISTRALAEDTDFSVDEKVMTIDYLSYVKLTKLVLGSMIKHKKGHIINISSLAGKIGSPMRTAYSGAKFALIGHYDSLRLEVNRHNVHVTNICPGSVRTEVDKNALSSSGEKFGIRDPDIQNGMTVERCAQLILAASSNKLSEAWLFGNRGQQFAAYLFQYMPWTARTLTLRNSSNLVEKAERLIKASPTDKHNDSKKE